MAFTTEYLEKEAVRLQSQAFLDKVKSISKDLKIQHNWLLAVMYFESARTFSPSVQAPNNPNYVGLIQFGHMAAQDLNTTVAKLKAMNALDQLDYVKRFYEMWIRRFTARDGKPFYYKNALELYSSTFYPASVGKSDDYVLGSADNTVAGVYAGNPWFDLNGDKIITYGEFLEYCRKNIFKEFSDESLGASLGKKGFFLDLSQYSSLVGWLPKSFQKELDNLIDYLVRKKYIERIA